MSPIVIEGHPFCNNLCHTEWKWHKSREDTCSLERDGRSRPSPNRSMKKMSELKEKGFQTDGNQREPPLGLVDKKKAKEAENRW